MKPRRALQTPVIAALLLALLVTIPATTQTKRAAHKLSPREIAAAIYPATVSIYVSDANNKRAYAGSGFIVGPELVATCFHLVKNPGEIIVITQAKDEYDKALDDLRGEKSSRSPRAATLYRYAETSDLALLRVPSLRASPLKLSKRQDHYIGDAIYTLGNPSGLEGSFSNGVISNFIRTGDVFYLQFTAPVSGGSSGSPVVDDQGQVIAIVDKQIREGQNLNFGVMVNHLSALIAGSR